jgi:2-alkyl-3-oxoalkanoate reductase
MAEKILITGATGFVGSHLAEILHRDGHALRALVRRGSRQDVLRGLGIELAEGSLEDPESLRRAAEGCSAVIHCAGAIKVRRGTGEFDEVNTAGTRRLLEACLAADASRFVLVSSLAAHGPAVSSVPRPVDAEAQPVSAYGRSKLAAEAEALRFADRLSVAVVRPPAIYGPRDVETFPFFRFASWGVLPIAGDGSSMVSLAYVTDVARALEQCATAKDLRSGSVYTVCDGGQYNWLEVMQGMAAVFGKRGRVLRLPLALFGGAARVGQLYGRLSGRPVMLGPDKVLELRQKYWICDNSRLHADLGFEPRVSLMEGLPLAVEWYRQNGWL